MQRIHALKPMKTEHLAWRYIPDIYIPGIFKGLEYVRHTWYMPDIRYCTDSRCAWLTQNASEFPTITYRLNNTLFSWQPPTSPHLGQGRREDCNSSDRQSSFCFNFSQAHQFVFCVQWLQVAVDRLDNVLIVSSLQYSRQWWARMNRSILQNTCHWAKIIATDFEVPGIYDSVFLFCWQIRAFDYSDLLYNYGLPISYRNQVRFTCLFSSIARWR